MLEFYFLLLDVLLLDRSLSEAQLHIIKQHSSEQWQSILHFEGFGGLVVWFFFLLVMMLILLFSGDL